MGVHGTVLHYDGSAWEKMRTDTSRDLCGVWGSSENDVFVAGRRGTILRYKGADNSLLTLRHLHK